MKTVRRPGRVIVAGVLAIVLGLAGIAVALADTPGSEGRSIEIPIRYSRFERADVTVPAGVPVTFVVRNGDPIDHEWIVGDDGVHERHRTGTEPIHGSRPTEVTVRAGTTASTIVTFERPGVYRFVCHLPGHEAYGMAGVVRVIGG